MFICRLECLGFLSFSSSLDDSYIIWNMVHFVSGNHLYFLSYHLCLFSIDVFMSWFIFYFVPKLGLCFFNGAFLHEKGL